ncbi:MAG TPA: SprT family zinc-dependent metalloprotease [Candidatus Limnocylindrales bacterium]|nr:SprT family zinc-dependent metalloprotease [Candidatus Limnocylindrales bacterium]
MIATEAPATVELPSGRLDYVVRRSPRSRRLRVTIDPERGVIVSLPPSTRRGWARPEGLVEAFLRERDKWLRRHLDAQARQLAEVAARGGVADGATIRFRGDLHRLRILDAADGVRRSSVVRVGAESGDELVVRVARRDRRAIGAVLEEWLRARARTAIEHDLARHAPGLRVEPAAITLRDPRTRWGSASRNRRLSFSWRLVLAPPEALETVVIHELAHLRYFGHGPRFWGLVASRRPDHATWRRWLRDHSVELHSALPDQD